MKKYVVIALLLLCSCDDVEGSDPSLPDGSVDTEEDAAPECEFGPCEMEVGGCLDEFGCCENFLDMLHDNPDEWCDDADACSCHPEDPCGWLSDGQCALPCDEAAGYDYPGEHWDPECDGV